MINICIYQDEPSSSLSIDQVSHFLNPLNINAEDRGNLFDYLGIDSRKRIEIAEYFDSIKIMDIESPLDNTGFPGELITSSDKSAPIRDKFYDAYWFQRKIYSLLYSHNSDEINDKYLHIVITGKLFGTFGTRRYHARVLLTGEPCLLSTSGIVEAPARPREYYFAKAKFLAEGRDISGLDEIFEDRFVDYNSPKITDITCSYILQLIKYSYTGEPFCSSNKCCLYNSHWQEEVLKLQYKKELCMECREILKI